MTRRVGTLSAVLPALIAAQAFWFVDAIAAADKAAPANNGQGTGGIPAVQSQLDDFEAQMAERRAALEALIRTQLGDLGQRLEESFDQKEALLMARAAALEAQLGVLSGDSVPPSVTGRLQEIKDTLFPCTQERLADGECDKNDPLDIEVQICGTMDARAAFNVAYSAELKSNLMLGVRWDEVPLGEASATLEFPGFVGIPGLPPVPVPSLSLSGEGGAGLTVTACLPGVRVAVPGNLPWQDRVDLLAAMQGPADDFLTTLSRIVGDLGLSPSKIEDLLEGLEVFQDPQVVLDDPLVFFDSNGPLRALADNLPVGDRVQEFLDDPERLLPTVDSCEAFIPDLGGGFEDLEDELCTVVDTTGQGFLDTIDTIDTGVGTVKGLVDKMPYCGDGTCNLLLLESCITCKTDCGKCIGESCSSGSDCFSGICLPWVPVIGRVCA